MSLWWVLGPVWHGGDLTAPFIGWCGLVAAGCACALWRPGKWVGTGIVVGASVAFAAFLGLSVAVLVRIGGA